MIRSFAAWLFALICTAAWAGPGEIVFVAPTSNTMPLAQFDNGVLTGGILKDLSEAIAQRLHVRARFVDAPSKRVSQLLAEGKADGLCYVIPPWLTGNFNWTRPLIPDGAVVLAAPDAPPIKSLQDLADQPVGTVIGYHYPELERALGKRFLRDDAATMELNLNKLFAGRRRYAISELTAIQYRLKREAGVHVRSDLVFVNFKAQCAFARHAAIPFERINGAVDSLLEDGSVEAILARYR